MFQNLLCLIRRPIEIQDRTEDPGVPTIAAPSRECRLGIRELGTALPPNLRDLDL